MALGLGTDAPWGAAVGLSAGGQTMTVRSWGGLPLEQVTHSAAWLRARICRLLLVPCTGGPLVNRKSAVPSAPRRRAQAADSRRCLRVRH